MNPYDVVKDFMARNGVEGSVVFAMVTGSQSYNLDGPSSDVDFMGVFQAPTRRFLSLNDPPQSASSLPTSQKPDVALYEIGYFAGLLLKGNPFIAELLINDRTEFLPEEESPSSPHTFRWLKDRRRQFITQTAVLEYLDYVGNRMKENAKRKLIGKRIYHCVRLLFEVRRMLRGHQPLVWIPEGEERHVLWEIREETVPEGFVENEVAKLLSEINEEKPWPTLPVVADRQLVEEWVVSRRLRQLETEEKR